MAYKRATFYPSEQIQSSVLMDQERSSSKSLFQFIGDALGSTTPVFAGLAATPGTGLTVAIGAGELVQYGEIDPTAQSTLAADTSQWMLQALLLAPQTLSGFAAAATLGDSINYLIEAQVVVTDAAAVNEPYTNGATPPVTVYQSVSPYRSNVLTFQVLAGAQAATGSQVTPSPTAGWVPLYAVTVDYGESQLVQADIALAANAPLFTGFVHSNPNGETPVFLSSPTAQAGFIDVTGNITGGGVITATSLLGGAAATTNYDGTWKNGFAGDYLSLTAIGFTGSKQVTDSLDIAGSIGYTGAAAGTDLSPYPLSQLNVAMLGGKVVADFALAAGAYITLYASAPTPGSGNAAITGYFEANVAQGTAPIQAVSTTQCPNLNAQYVGGYAPGNAAGEVAVSNGTICSNLNANFLNGLASSAFQPAGSYAAMNLTNPGYFDASGAVGTTGGTSGLQTFIAYAATNSYGMNGGGALSYLMTNATALGLIGAKVLTSGPLYVGGDSANQNVYAQDLVPSGLVRSGMCIYTVTYGGTANTFPFPGNGSPWGTYASFAGQLHVATDGVLNSTFYIGYRTKITLNASLTVTFQGIGFASGTVYVDGVSVGTVGGQMSGFSYTFSAGTHAVDIIYSSANLGQEFYEGSYGVVHNYGGSLTVFGWVPFPSGKLSSAITALAPG